jgi:ABC-type phosphate/phosphonate transport system substrate-binding protein
VRRELEPDLREALRRALLDLASDPDGARVLAQFGALRFVEATTDEYAPVLALVHRARIHLRKYQYRNE